MEVFRLYTDFIICVGYRNKNIKLIKIKFNKSYITENVENDILYHL